VYNPRPMLILLAILIFIYNFTAMFYQLSGIEPLPTVEFLYVVALPCGIVWWFRSETCKSAVTQVYCEGMTTYYAFVFTVPYHLLKTRGVKGLLPLLVLVASYVGSQLLAVILYFVFVADLSTY
jgi:hypothetical protein